MHTYVYYNYVAIYVAIYLFIIQLYNNVNMNACAFVVPHVCLHYVLDMLMLASWTNAKYDEFDKGSTGLITCADV